jgi:pimeloyl-ACP methyl ester carboxylesterase
MVRRRSTVRFRKGAPVQRPRSWRTPATSFPRRATNGRGTESSSQARAIEVPAIVVAGENDRLEPEQVLRDNLLLYLTTAELLVIPRTGHLSPLEAPADVARILQMTSSS